MLERGCQCVHCDNPDGRSVTRQRRSGRLKNVRWRTYRIKTKAAIGEHPRPAAAPVRSEARGAYMEHAHVLIPPRQRHFTPQPPPPRTPHPDVVENRPTPRFMIRRLTNRVRKPRKITGNRAKPPDHKPNPASAAVITARANPTARPPANARPTAYSSTADPNNRNRPTRLTIRLPTRSAPTDPPTNQRRYVIPSSASKQYDDANLNNVPLTQRQRRIFHPQNRQPHRAPAKRATHANHNACDEDGTFGG
ncbi:hypothetical protein KCP73_02755 [Salmonella enterica subsp. enterica]|nr:hypothetical protein KCP73_02755 [Salmonella enterica subsp. enterica]